MKNTAFLGLAFSFILLSLSSTSCTKAQKISSAEKDNLVFMIEEEKMARDVYRQLYLQTNIQAFQNIAYAEQRHMDRIAGLLESTNIENPVTNMQEGKFKNTAIRDLYQKLIDQASVSEIEALKTAAWVEEKDIQDLRKAIDASINKQNIQTYQRLEQASQKHLNAFVGHLQQRGVVYQAQVLTDEEVETILNTDQRGNGRKGPWH